MIRMIILSIAACLSTVGGVYGAVAWKKSASEIANKPAEPKVQVLKTHMVSVPILTDGQVLGYVVTRMQFTADVDQLKASTVQPEAFVADEAFKIIYDTTPSDIKTGRKQALRDLTSSIVERRQQAARARRGQGRLYRQLGLSFQAGHEEQP